MKISIISAAEASSPGRQAVNSIISAAQRRGIKTEISDLKNLNKLSAWVDSLGEVVIFRWASAVRNATKRTRVFEAIRSKRILINDIIIDYPHLRWKDWQQNFVSHNTSINTIPTWRFNSLTDWHQAVSKQVLSFPLIQKPRGGVLGIDVKLIRSPSDLADISNLSRYIWQPYIPNHGDYRVLVIGGLAIGSMHRSAAKGRITNNISQGGTGSKVNDQALASTLESMSQQIQRAIPLDIVGIDIIQSLSDKRFYFLELNIMPAWMEFEAVTQINVGEKVVDLCQRRHQASLTVTPK